MKILTVVTVAVVLIVGAAFLYPTETCAQTETPCSDALNRAFDAASSAHYFTFAGKRIEIANQYCPVKTRTISTAYKIGSLRFAKGIS